MKIRMKDVLEEFSFIGFDEGSLEICLLFRLMLEVVLEDMIRLHFPDQTACCNSFPTQK